MPRDWDAATYDRVSDPQFRWAAPVLTRLPLRGDERVLDAGCGSGRVTERLIERLPTGHVVALDASERMIAEARTRLGYVADRITFVQADLQEPLPVAPAVDAVFSTATFHWVTDHLALFRNLAAVMRPGASLVAQCGGAGNIAAVMDVLAGLGDGWLGSWTFAAPEETRDRLAAAGFEDIQTWLNDEPTTFEPGEPFESFLATVVLGNHLARLAEADRPSFVRAVASRLPRPELAYVRLNIVARRAR